MSEGGANEEEIITCKRCRKIGYNANNWIENNIRAKTDTFVGRREANTTDADTAAFMESTDERLQSKCEIGLSERNHTKLTFHVDPLDLSRCNQRGGH
jgi:hypothetical protein